MPRLLIDGTALGTANKGVGRYTYNLCIQAVRRLPADWEIIIARFPQELPSFPAGLKASFVVLPNASDLFKGLFLMPRLLSRIRPSALLRPMESAGYNYGVPMITVCHDISALIRQATRKPFSLWRGIVDRVNDHFQIRAMRASALVVCNSIFIREAVERRYGIPHNRTALGYCGVDSCFYEMSRGLHKDVVRQKYGVARYILTFATGDLREGFDLLPDILAKMKARNIGTCLIIAGVEIGSQYVDELRRRIVAFGLIEERDFRFEDFLAEDRLADLVRLYTAADFYLELSRHEGFGMQLAEAMACGTTCIASMGGALREVAGEFAIEIDPADAGCVADAIADAYQRGEHARDNAQQIEHTRKFNWDAVGKLVVEKVLQLAD
jgi:glycosyltransferase involved in cell wall biosynthesis